MARSKRKLRESLEKKSTNKKVKKSQDIDDEKALYICGKCYLQMRESEQAMSCEDCEEWYHLACIKMSSEFYRMIKKCAADLKGLIWLCDGCKNKFDDFVQQREKKNATPSSLPLHSSTSSNKSNTSNLSLPNQKKKVTYPSFEELLDAGQQELEDLRRKKMKRRDEELIAKIINKERSDALKKTCQKELMSTGNIGGNAYTGINEDSEFTQDEEEILPSEFLLLYADEFKRKEPNYLLKLLKKINFTGSKENSLLQCKNCNFNTFNELDAIVHCYKQHVYENENILTCKLCSYITIKVNLLQQHLITHEDDGDEIYRCFGCNFSATSKVNLQNHAFNKHSKEIMFCPTCNFSTWDLSSLKYHSIGSHDLDFIHCNLCSFFPTGDDEAHLKKELTVHLFEEHNVIELFCNQCEFSTSSQPNLDEHVLSHE